MVDATDLPQSRSKSYSDKLRDNRWRRKRNEILIRDDYSCQVCGDTEKEVQVHHRYYTADSEPWEYPNGALVTLCETCHSRETTLYRKTKNSLRAVGGDLGFYQMHWLTLASALFRVPHLHADEIIRKFLTALAPHSDEIKHVSDKFEHYLATGEIPAMRES